MKRTLAAPAALIAAALATSAAAKTNGVLHLSPPDGQFGSRYYAGNYEFYAFSGLRGVDGNLGDVSGEDSIGISRLDGGAFNIASVLAQGGNGDSVNLVFFHTDGTIDFFGYVPTAPFGSLALLTFNESDVVLAEIASLGGPLAIQDPSLSDLYAAPEPSTWALLTMGVGGIGLGLRTSAARRRRRQLRPCLTT